MHHHGAGLRRWLKDDVLAAVIIEDYKRADLSPADRTMLDYVAKLTETPAAVDAGDVKRLAAAGFSESAILDVCQVAAYFAFVNRLVDGLGVEIEKTQEGEK